MTPLQRRHNGRDASQITSLTNVYSTAYSGADQRKHQSSASLAFVRGIHRWPVNSPDKGPATREMFPFDDVIMPVISHDSTYYTGNSVTKWTDYPALQVQHIIYVDVANYIFSRL